MNTAITISITDTSTSINHSLVQSLLRHQSSQNVSLGLRTRKLDTKLVTLLLHSSQSVLEFLQAILAGRGIEIPQPARLVVLPPEPPAPPGVPPDIVEP